MNRATYSVVVEHGVTKLYEVNYLATIDQDVLMGVIKVEDTRPFNYDNRRFYLTVYANEGLLTQVIECETLFWQLPLEYRNENDSFYVSTGEEERDKQYSVGIKNAILIIHTGDKARIDYNMYITLKNKKVPQVVNIYDDGRLCLKGRFNSSTPPENIISLIESSPGTNHLLQDHVTDASDSRTSTIPLHEENGIIYASPYAKRNLNHEKIQYLRHINNH